MTFFNVLYIEILKIICIHLENSKTNFQIRTQMEGNNLTEIRSNIAVSVTMTGNTGSIHTVMLI